MSEEAVKTPAQEAAKAEAKVEDPVQKELEAKKREVIDLTVRFQQQNLQSPPPQH